MLTERQRAVLERELGEEVAEILIAQHPEDLVSKDFLRAEMAELGERFEHAVRLQTVWLTSVLAAAISIVAALG